MKPKLRHVVHGCLVLTAIALISTLHRDSRTVELGTDHFANQWQSYRSVEPLKTVNASQLNPDELSINHIRPGMALPKVLEILGQPNVAQAQIRTHYYFVDGNSKNYRTVVKYDAQNRVASVQGAVLLHGSSAVLTHGADPKDVTATLGEDIGFRRDPETPPTIHHQTRFEDIEVFVDWRGGLVDSVTLSQPEK